MCVFRSIFVRTYVLFVEYDLKNNYIYFFIIFLYKKIFTIFFFLLYFGFEHISLSLSLCILFQIVNEFSLLLEIETIN